MPSAKESRAVCGQIRAGLSHFGGTTSTVPASLPPPSLLWSESTYDGRSSVGKGEPAARCPKRTVPHPCRWNKLRVPLGRAKSAAAQGRQWRATYDPALARNQPWKIVMESHRWLSMYEFGIGSQLVVILRKCSFRSEGSGRAARCVARFATQ